MKQGHAVKITRILKKLIMAAAITICANPSKAAEFLPWRIDACYGTDLMRAHFRDNHNYYHASYFVSHVIQYDCFKYEMIDVNPITYNTGNCVRITPTHAGIPLEHSVIVACGNCNVPGNRMYINAFPFNEFDPWICGDAGTHYCQQKMGGDLYPSSTDPNGYCWQDEIYNNPYTCIPVEQPCTESTHCKANHYKSGAVCVPCPCMTDSDGITRCGTSPDREYAPPIQSCIMSSQWTFTDSAGTYNFQNNCPASH